MRPLLRLVLFVVNVVGLNPLQRNIFAKLRLIFALSTAFLLLLATLLILLQWEGVKTFASIYMLPSLLMFAAKIITLHVNRDLLRDIIINIESFWPADKFGLESGKKINQLHGTTFAVAGPFYAITLIIVAILAFAPLILNNRLLTFPGYYFCDVETSPCFEIIHSWHGVTLFLHCYPVVLGFDSLFVYFIGEGYSAIELLKLALRKIRISYDIEYHEHAEEIAEFSHQHAIVLKYISNMRDFYSGVLLVQMWCTLGALIFCLYVITSEGVPPPLRLLPIYGGMFIVVNLQFFIYCFGGAIIMEQTLTVADEAYHIDWWKQTQPNFRRKLAYIIQRSQKAQKLTVGNIYDLNLVCFGAVLRNVISVYGLLQTIENKSIL